MRKLDFEKMWMTRKRELIGIIEAGKEAEKESEYTPESYRIAQEGEKAEEALLRMIKSELDEFFEEEENDG